MWDEVPAAVLDEVLAEAFRRPLARDGFEPAGSRKWVRSTKPEIHELVEVHSLKGGLLTPCWGFSLDFVPHVTGANMRWHRTPKSSRLDLRYDPVDYDERWQDIWAISRLNGRENAARTAGQVAARVTQEARLFFDKVQSIQDLQAAFEEKINRPNIRFGFHNYVQEPLAYSFVDALLGRLNEGRERLAQFVRDHELSPQLARKLSTAMETASTSGKSP